MVEIECRGEPCVRPRTKTSIEPMVENIYKSFAFGHRFDNGFCSRANIRFAPTFIFGHRLKKYTRTALSPINWIRPSPFPLILSKNIIEKRINLIPGVRLGNNTTESIILIICHNGIIGIATGNDRFYFRIDFQ